MSALQTTVRNTSAGELRFSFLPPHGVILQPNETYSWLGTLADVGAAAGPETGSRARAFRAFQFCLDNNLLTLLDSGTTPAGVEVSLGDFPTGGVIGTAADTIDTAAGIGIAQTTPGQSLTLPAPSDLSASRIVAVSNTGTTAFSLEGALIGVGQSSLAIWSATDSEWRMVSAGSGAAGGAFFTSDIPVGPGEVGQITFVVAGDYEGFLYVHDGADWVYQTQYRVPVFTVEPEPTLQRVIDIAAELPFGEFYVDYAESGTLSRYRIFANGIVEGPMTGGGGSLDLPPDALGNLRNDGSGNLSWQDANRQYTHTQATPSAVWNVNHNLNSQVDSVNIYVGGQLVGADVTIVDLDNLTITFAAPEVGIAIVET
jgi:hypothetical protein